MNQCEIKLGEAGTLRELKNLLEPFSDECPVISDKHRMVTVFYVQNNGEGFLVFKNEVREE